MDATLDEVLAIVKDLYKEVKEQKETIMSLQTIIDKYDEDNDILLTPTQAASYLGISRSGLTLWRRCGKITMKVRNGSMGYLRKDLEKYRKV